MKNLSLMDLQRQHHSHLGNLAQLRGVLAMVLPARKKGILRKRHERSQRYHA